MSLHYIFRDIERALNEAKHLYPVWPKHLTAMNSILQEEAGEITQAVNDYELQGKGDLKHIYEELMQTAAMCVRLAQSLDCAPPCHVTMITQPPRPPFRQFLQRIDAEQPIEFTERKGCKKNLNP